jgi:hypothetical protein
VLYSLLHIEGFGNLPENHYFSSMERKEYRMTPTGRIFTQEAYMEYHVQVLGDYGILAWCWDKLPIIEVPDPDKIPEYEKKLSFIYGMPKFKHL